MSVVMSWLAAGSYFYFKLIIIYYVSNNDKTATDLNSLSDSAFELILLVCLMDAIDDSIVCLESFNSLLLSFAVYIIFLGVNLTSLKRLIGLSG